MYSNVNAIGTKLDEFKLTVDKLKPDFILLTETWIRPDTSDSLYALTGYEMFRNDRENQRGGGVCIYAKNTIAGHNVQLYVNNKYTMPPSTNSIWINASIGGTRLLLGCVYKPGGIPVADEESLNAAIANALNEDCVTFVFGDFNHPEINWQSLTLEHPNVSAQNFLTAYTGWNASQLVNFPTRYRGMQSSLLDLILLNDKKLLAEIKAHPPIGLSDHIVITAITQLKILLKPTRVVYKRNFWKADYNQVNDHFKNNFPETNEYGECLTVIKTAIDTYIPERRVRVNPQKPWINQEILRSIRKKRELWDRYEKVKSPEKYTIYQNHNNALKAQIKTARQQYEESLVTQSNKQFYKYVRRSLNSNITTFTLKDDASDQMVAQPDRVAQLFAEQFGSQFTHENLTNMPIMDQSTRVRNELVNVSITAEVVINTLAMMKTDSSPGPDGIPTVFLQKCKETVAPLLAEAMKQIMDTGNLPAEWRKAYVTPIFKKGSKYEPSNYRPISLTCNPCKCMEKIIAQEITSFLLDQLVIPPTQHGFLPKRSTVSNLLSCLNEWTKAHDNNEPVDTIYLDYEKAFDKVPHNRLLIKLEHYGIRGKLLRWIECFLKNRSCEVRIGNDLSSPYEVTSGVPQGSVLGPLLFVIYISDLASDIKSNISFFADDTKIFGNPLLNHNTMLEDLNILEVWTEKWQLKLNETKCTVLHLGPNNPHVGYSLNNTKLAPVSQQKDLGIIISSDLKWEAHISKIVKKANSVLFLIQRAFENKSVQMIGAMYKTFVRPILEYAHSVWNPYFIKDIEILERVQRRATKIPELTKHLPYEERLRVFGLTTLRERRLRGDLIETYKLLQQHYAVDLDIFHINQNPNLRGHIYKLNKERCSRLPRKNFLTNRVVYPWNGLRQETVTAGTINTFKNMVDRDLQQNNANFIHYL